MKNLKKHTAPKARDPQRVKYLADMLKRFEQLYNAEPDASVTGSQPQSK